jgi:hypothetical protein
MRHKRVKLIAVILLGLGLTGLRAQNTVSASGGNASGSGGTVTYSVGQVGYTTLNGTSGSVAQGVQQPYEISVISGLEAAREISLMVSAFPNPATEYLTLEVKDYPLSALSYRLFDMDGKLVEAKKIESNQTNIAMNNLVPASYLLLVIEGNTEVKSFKVVKN